MMLIKHKKLSMPVPVFMLGIVNMLPSVLIVSTFALVLIGVAKICNMPAIMFLSIIAALYLLSGISLLLRKPMLGFFIGNAAIAASIVNFCWIWLASGFILTTEMVFQLVHVIFAFAVFNVFYRRWFLIKEAAV